MGAEVTVLGHGVITYHTWLCRRSILPMEAPSWMPEWVPGLCRSYQIHKAYPTMSDAVLGRRDLLARLHDGPLTEGLTIDVHIDGAGPCDL